MRRGLWNDDRGWIAKGLVGKFRGQWDTLEVFVSCFDITNQLQV